MPIARNPKTGEVVFLDQDGQWKPANIAQNRETGESLAFDGSKWQPVELKQSESVWEAVGGFIDDFSNFTSGVVNTFTGGLSDAVAGAGSALAKEVVGSVTGQFPTNEELKQAFQEPAEKRKEFAAENPKTAILASVMGGVASPFGQKAGEFVNKGITLGDKTLRSAIAGGVLAGGQTAGESLADLDKSVAEKGVDISLSTAAGSGVGAVIPGGIEVAKKTGKGLFDFFTKFFDKTQASIGFRKVFEALQRDGYTPEEALKRIQDLGPEAALIDAGKNTRALGFTAAATPGRGKQIVTDFLVSRQEGTRDASGRLVGGQINRIINHMERLVPEKFFSTKNTLARVNKSSELYKTAYAANKQIDDPIINRLLTRPAGLQALKNARETLQNKGTALSAVDKELTEQAKEAGLGVGKVGKGFKLEFLDLVKRELWDLEQAAKGADFKPTAASDAITDIRRALTNRLDAVDATKTAGKKLGDYAMARRIAGDKLSNIEALENGRDFLRGKKFGSAEELGAALEEMSPQQRHMFRVGASQAMKEKFSGLVSRADATKKGIDIPSLEKRIEQAFGSKELFKRYVDFMNQEKELFRSVTDVLSNSKTAERLEALADADIDPSRFLRGFAEIKSGTPGGIVRGAVDIVQGGIEKATVSPRQAEEIAKILTGRGIEGLQQGALIRELTEGGAGTETLETVIRSAIAPTIGANQ